MNKPLILPKSILFHVSVAVKVSHATAVFVPFATGFTRRASIHHKINDTNGLTIFDGVVTPQVHGFLENGFDPFLVRIPELLHKSRLVPIDYMCQYASLETE